MSCLAGALHPDASPTFDSWSPQLSEEPLLKLAKSSHKTPLHSIWSKKESARGRCHFKDGSTIGDREVVSSKETTQSYSLTGRMNDLLGWT